MTMNETRVTRCSLFSGKWNCFLDENQKNKSKRIIGVER